MAGNDTRPVRYYVYSVASGKTRMSAHDSDQAAIEAIRDLDWPVNVTREEGPLGKPEITVIWQRDPMSLATELDDVEAVLATLVLSEEAIRPWSGVEAVTVRAILALSRAGDENHSARRPHTGRALKIRARALMAELINERHG